MKSDVAESNWYDGKEARLLENHSPQRRACVAVEAEMRIDLTGTRMTND